MRWALVDETGEPYANLQRLAAALEIQQTRDYAPLWQASPIYVQAFESLVNTPTDSDWALMVFLKDADQAGALGYHDVTPTGRPYARVFTGPSLEAGSTWFTGPEAVSITASHEGLEGTTNPYVTWWQDSGRGYLRALEACDLVETDSYLIDGVPVSNFLTPRAFSMGKVGPYDAMGLLSDPYAAPRPGCYEIRAKGPGKEYPVMGEGMRGHKLAAKAHPASRTAKLLRLAELTVIDQDVPTEHVDTLRHLWRLNQRIRGTQEA